MSLYGSKSLITDQWPGKIIPQRTKTIYHTFPFPEFAVSHSWKRSQIYLGSLILLLSVKLVRTERQRWALGFVIELKSVRVEEICIRNELIAIDFHSSLDSVNIDCINFLLMKFYIFLYSVFKSLTCQSHTFSSTMLQHGWQQFLNF